MDIDNNERKTTLLKTIKTLKEENQPYMSSLLDEFLFLESELENLKKYPMFEVKQGDDFKQRTTPAGKRYLEVLQQYHNISKTIFSQFNKIEFVEDTAINEFYELLQTLMK
ncbi:hypothetical protein [Anaerofustis stercorihominis]|uniref:hypothetical protein n=1 Tax=Anaerofustis stercorihominis TaxID=214853 RepID=UPI002671B8B7|nr:hypothetical protein [Anaerofustis stercorihominis]